MLRWCVNRGVCWERTVDKWCLEAWKKQHKDRQKRSKGLLGKPHHQGNGNLGKYAKAVPKRTLPCSQYQAFALSHIGRGSKVAPYNAKIVAWVYTSGSSYDRKTKYDKAFENKYGSESEPSAHDLDPEVVMLAGEGKKHGRFSMGGSILSWPPLPLSLCSRFDGRA